jgi:hypothetical protein
MKRNSKRQSKKQPPKHNKPNNQDDFKDVLLSMFGFDINNNQDLQNLYLQQCLLDALAEKGLISDEQFFRCAFRNNLFFKI